jgi:hypothetical protein
MTPSRRGYWLSMAALAVVLPATLAVSGWGSFVNWRMANVREPTTAQVGQKVDYAGAQWTVTRLTRLADGEGRAVVLAEFEATIPDPEALASVPCEIGLSDGEGRTWRPVFLGDPVVRAMYPEAMQRALCGGPSFAEAQGSEPVRMAASFSIPASARDLTLSIALLSALPAYLSVSEPQP